VGLAAHPRSRSPSSTWGRRSSRRAARSGLNGSALHYVLNNERSRFDFSFLTQYPLLINAMTYMALAMEFALAFFIWFRAARPFVLYLGLMLHAGILNHDQHPVLRRADVDRLTGLPHPARVRRLPPCHRRPSPLPQGKSEGDRGTRARDRGLRIPRPAPTFRPSSIIVRIDSGSGIAGPHSIDVRGDRSLQRVGGRYDN